MANDFERERKYEVWSGDIVERAAPMNISRNLREGDVLEAAVVAVCCYSMVSVTVVLWVMSGLDLTAAAVPVTVTA